MIGVGEAFPDSISADQPTWIRGPGGALNASESGGSSRRKGESWAGVLAVVRPDSPADPAGRATGRRCGLRRGLPCRGAVRRTSDVPHGAWQASSLDIARVQTPWVAIAAQLGISSDRIRSWSLKWSLPPEGQYQHTGDAGRCARRSEPTIYGCCRPTCTMRNTCCYRKHPNRANPRRAAGPALHA